MKGTVNTEIVNIATYQPPGILATFNGKLVRLIATGDSPGHSPVEKFIDENGHLNWAEQNDFTVIDTAFLPPSQQGVTSALRSCRASSNPAVA